MRLCAVCAKQGRTCCVSRDILLSIGDLHRITAHIGQSDFFELRAPHSSEYLHQEDDPNWNLYTLRGNGCRRVLKHSRPGICWFLRDSGCVLPEAVRPLVCRLHPFEYNEEVLTGLSRECPADHLPPGQTLLANLAMNFQAGEEWRCQLYDELRAERNRTAKSGPEKNPDQPASLTARREQCING
ncbi:YkgJ family cysteine cluster protein [Thiovibrio sp. JS02]